MGWTSTSDTSEQTRTALAFNNKDEAIAFASKMGWAYSVELPNVRRSDRAKRYAGYGDNYRCEKVLLRVIYDRMSYHHYVKNA